MRSSLATGRRSRLQTQRWGNEDHRGDAWRHHDLVAACLRCCWRVPLGRLALSLSDAGEQLVEVFVFQVEQQEPDERVVVHASALREAIPRLCVFGPKVGASVDRLHPCYSSTVGSLKYSGQISDG